MADPLILLIPVIAAIVGWGTNVVAVKMMFYPVRFVGVRPWFGWRGIVPANAVGLANRGLRLITRRLLDIREIFRGLDPEAVLGARSARLEEMADRLLEETATKHFAKMWGALSPEIRSQVHEMGHKEVAKLARSVLDQARDRIDELLDVERMVVDAVRSDPGTMGRIFLGVAPTEFKFIERSGAYFGLLFGIVQLGVWVLYPAWWVLPFFGLLVGYATNWLAIRLIFEPREPIRVGPLKLQGLFHRRQKAISAEFARIITTEVLSSEHIFEALATGEPREKILGIVRDSALALVENYRSHPMAKGILASAPVSDIESELMDAIAAEIFREGGLVHAFADQSGAIRETFRVRMGAMDPESFEGVLRPAFQTEEWKLILAGAALGLAAGILQLAYLFGDMVL